MPEPIEGPWRKRVPADPADRAFLDATAADQMRFLPRTSKRRQKIWRSALDANRQATNALFELASGDLTAFLDIADEEAVTTVEQILEIEHE